MGKEMKLRIYLDTSVIGGCFDDEFEEASNLLFEKFIKRKFLATISELTILELENAPENVQKIIKKIPSENIEILELTEEANELALKYINEGVLGKGKLVDAQHIAIATIHRIDVLVSWNFKHIVNLQRIRGYNSVNLKLGYPLLEIRTPWEVLNYEE